MSTTPQTDHPCFPQPANRASKVWRYMDLAKFVSLLADKSLHLTRMDLLRDPHEGSIPIPNYRDNLEIWKSLGLAENEHNLSRIGRAVREGTYVSCWMLRDDESEAMWRLYCGEHQGIAIRTSYEKLATAISEQKSTFIGKVTYVDFERTRIPSGNLFYATMHKRLAFEHEAEVRIATVMFDQITAYIGDVENKKNLPLSWPIAVDLEALIEGIYIHPYAHEWFENSVRSVINALSPSLISRINWSRIKSDPHY